MQPSILKIKYSSKNKPPCHALFLSRKRAVHRLCVFYDISISYPLSKVNSFLSHPRPVPPDLFRQNMTQETLSRLFFLKNTISSSQPQQTDILCHPLNQHSSVTHRAQQPSPPASKFHRRHDPFRHAFSNKNDSRPDAKYPAEQKHRPYPPHFRYTQKNRYGIHRICFFCKQNSNQIKADTARWCKPVCAALLPPALSNNRLRPRCSKTHVVPPHFRR